MLWLTASILKEEMVISMRIQTHRPTRLQTRRDARACRWHVCAVVSCSGVAVMSGVGTLFTAKINPGAGPGGHPDEGEP
jgi:hypothetical protein